MRKILFIFSILSIFLLSSCYIDMTSTTDDGKFTLTVENNTQAGLTIDYVCLQPTGYSTYQTQYDLLNGKSYISNGQSYTFYNLKPGLYDLYALIYNSGTYVGEKHQKNLDCVDGHDYTYTIYLNNPSILSDNTPNKD